MTDEEYYLHYWRLWHHHFDDTDMRCLPNAQELAGKRVLEVGCGDGRLTFKLAPLVAEIVAVDYDERFILAANRRQALNSFSNVEFRQMDAHALEFADGSFDYVLYPWVLQMVKDPESVVAEGCRVLASGGQLVVIAMEPGSDYDRIIDGFSPSVPVGALSMVDLYEQPILKAFGRPARPEKQNVPFGYAFPTLATAHEAFLFALTYWHKTEVDEAARQRLADVLASFRTADGINLIFPATVYAVQKL